MTASARWRVAPAARAAPAATVAPLVVMRVGTARARLRDAARR